MFEKFQDIFSKIKLSDIRIRNRGPVKKIVHEEQGRIYKTWLFILPVLCGLALGRLVSIMLGVGLSNFIDNAGVIDETTAAYSDRAAEIENQRGLDGFLDANPFHISEFNPLGEVKAEEPKPEVKEEPDTGLKDLILRGTLPGIGAWVENKDNLVLLLVGKDIERYKLTKVTYSEATFKRGENSVIKYITYGPLADAPKKAEAPKKAAAPAPAPAPVDNSNSTNVIAAVPGGQEGEVSSETVNQLVQNPFDELKRVRIRPSEVAGGLEVQWIQNDSILKRLGVRKGDVIRSVNGIPFTNMGDIANSINSLMNSERFDVEVTREGKNEALRYVVR